MKRSPPLNWVLSLVGRPGAPHIATGGRSITLPRFRQVSRYDCGSSGHRQCTKVHQCMEVILPALNVCQVCSKPKAEHGQKVSKNICATPVSLSGMVLA